MWACIVVYPEDWCSYLIVIGWQWGLDNCWCSIGFKWSTTYSYGCCRTPSARGWLWWIWWFKYEWCSILPFCCVNCMHLYPFLYHQRATFFFFLASKLVILFSLSCFPFTPSTNGGTRGHRVVASGHSPAPQKEKYSLRKFYRNSPFT